MRVKPTIVCPLKREYVAYIFDFNWLYAVWKLVFRQHFRFVWNNEVNCVTEYFFWKWEKAALLCCLLYVRELERCGYAEAVLVVLCTIHLGWFCRHPRWTRQTRGLLGSTDQIPCWDRRSVVCPHSDWRQIPILWCLRSPIWVVATLVLLRKSTWGSAYGVRDQPLQGFDEFRCL